MLKKRNQRWKPINPLNFPSHLINTTFQWISVKYFVCCIHLCKHLQDSLGDLLSGRVTITVVLGTTNQWNQPELFMPSSKSLFSFSFEFLSFSLPPSPPSSEEPEGRKAYNHSAKLVSSGLPPRWRNSLSTGDIHLISTEWKCWNTAQNLGQCIYLDINIYIEMKRQNSFLLSDHWNLQKYKGIQLI